MDLSRIFARFKSFYSIKLFGRIFGIIIFALIFLPLVNTWFNFFLYFLISVIILNILIYIILLRINPIKYVKPKELFFENIGLLFTIWIFIIVINSTNFKSGVFSFSILLEIIFIIILLIICEHTLNFILYNRKNLRDERMRKLQQIYAHKAEKREIIKIADNDVELYRKVRKRWERREEMLKKTLQSMKLRFLEVNLIFFLVGIGFWLVFISHLRLLIIKSGFNWPSFSKGIITS